MRKDTPRIFLDSNIWFSAFYGSVNCQKLIKAHLEGKIRVIISSQVIEESIRNLKEKKPQVLASFQEMLLNNPPEIIKDPDNLGKKIKKLVDEKDGPIFGSALLGEATFFVTGNIRDFSVQKLEKATGIKVITPMEAVNLLHL